MLFLTNSKIAVKGQCCGKFNNFSFPRAGVGTHSRRANVAGPQAHKNGTWEQTRFPRRRVGTRKRDAGANSVPTPARGNQKPGRGSKRNRFPRRRVGTRNRDVGVNGIGSHAGAWEPENRDVGANGIGSHAGAWEPEKNID